jgi:2-C-methyl-D-erythritol 2,4-cyclodiphosphate synthase
MGATFGIGYDTHRFAVGRPLILGGVEVPYEAGLAGHSDADVLAHAIVDALLGAAGLGDIGQHFPDTDERYKDVDSMVLLDATLAMLADHGLAVSHVDSTLMMEAPKLGEKRAEIRSRLARALGVEERHCNVKATTGEGMGFVGRGEGAGAIAVATVEPVAG